MPDFGRATDLQVFIDALEAGDSVPAEVSAEMPNEAPSEAADPPVRGSLSESSARAAGARGPNDLLVHLIGEVLTHETPRRPSRNHPWRSALASKLLPRCPPGFGHIRTPRLAHRPTLWHSANRGQRADDLKPAPGANHRLRLGVSARRVWLSIALVGIALAGVVIIPGVAWTAAARIPFPSSADGDVRVEASRDAAPDETLRDLFELPSQLVATARPVIHGLIAPIREATASLGVSKPQASEPELPSAAQAYRAQFGHSLDGDLEEYGAEVQEWLDQWEAAYRKGEPWARNMVPIKEP